MDDNKVIDLKEFGDFVKTISDKQNSEKDTNTNKKDSTNDVVLFFSFDVVNSTLYKTINYFGWSKVINNFFLKLQDEVNRKIVSSQLWRILGDEAIFIVKIRDKEEIIKYVNSFNSIFIDTLNALKDGKFISIENKCNRELELEKRQNILSLKATAWIALVNNTDGEILDDEGSENVFVRYISSSNSSKFQFFEFLGNDIDTGFRISKYTRDKRLAVSFELAYILNEYTKESSKLHIITYKNLKGVWSDKLYPIIWYHDKEKWRNEDFEDTFIYDDIVENDLINEYFQIRSEKTDLMVLPLRMYTDVNWALMKIAIDRNLVSKILKIKTAIPQSKDNYIIDATELELHCVAVCYLDNKILIAKRNSKKKPEKLQGLWEFGCAKANKKMKLIDSIEKEYLSDFGVKIKLVTDQNRVDTEPVPLAIYQVKKEDNLHKGIVFLAEIVDKDYNPKSFLEDGKHSELRWIEENQINTIEDENAVPDFKDTLRKSFAKIKELGRQDSGE